MLYKFDVGYVERFKLQSKTYRKIQNIENIK